MADMNVERKQRSLLPWILGVAVLALLIWGLVELLNGGQEAEEGMAKANAPAPAAVTPPVSTAAAA